MKVAVTGASGYLGNCLCKTLVEQDIRLKVLVHKNKNEFVKMDTEIIFGDILNKKTLQDLVDDADVVYHLAAALSIGEKNRNLVHEINVKGTQNIIEACNSQKVKKLVYFSTIKTLLTSGPNENLDESTPLITYSDSAYDSSKAEAERLVLQAAEQGLDVVILNPTAIIGPFDSQPSYLGKALIKIYQNRIPMLVSGGYDFVDIRDVIEGAIKAASKGRKGERYILSGGWLSLSDLSKKIEQLTGKKTTKFTAPIFLARAGLPFINLYSKCTGDQPLYTSESLDNIKYSNKCISNMKARQELGFIPRPIENTLADAFAWFKQHKMV